MTSPRALRRLFSLAAVAAVAVVPLAQAAPATTQYIPPDIVVPAGQKLFLTAHAEGEQIYTCNAVAGGFAWSPATPRADLYDNSGKVIGTHFGGPTWQAKDGSKFVGQRDKGVIMDTSAIPWLRLSKVTASAGPNGDRFAGTTYIQRVNTVAGLTPPASDCTANTVTDKTAVDYSADYLFYKALGV